MKNCSALLAAVFHVASAGHMHIRSHQRAQRLPPQCSYSEDKECYFLLYFSGSQFCSSTNIQCLEVQPDGHCRMTNGIHTKMESSGGKYNIVSSSESDCSCYNGVATYSAPADSNEEVSGFSSSCKDGVKLVKGKWCEKTSMDPSYACATGGKFTENIKSMCNGNYGFDVLNGDMCNKVGFHLMDRKIISNGPPANTSLATPGKESSPPRSATSPHGVSASLAFLVFALCYTQSF